MLLEREVENSVHSPLLCCSVTNVNDNAMVFDSFETSCEGAYYDMNEVALFVEFVLLLRKREVGRVVEGISEDSLCGVSKS